MGAIISRHAAYFTVKADFHSVQFSERAKFCDRFLLKCVQSAISNEIRSTCSQGVKWNFIYFLEGQIHFAFKLSV